MKRTIIRESVEITEDEFTSPAFILESDDQTTNGCWLMAESDQVYAMWFADREAAESFMNSKENA
jgi:hypothetical protein